MDSAFEKVTPLEGGGSRCRSQYWSLNIGKGAESQIGTARTTVIALHYVTDHWCCAAADLTSRKLVYYDPYYPDPDLRALGALGEYVDQVALDQGAHVEIGATTFKHKLCSTPEQPDTVSCGICVLIEIQRIAEGNIDSPRNRRSDVAELARYRARWACEIMSNPKPTWSRAMRTPTGRRAAMAPDETDDSYIEMGETRPPMAMRSVVSSKPGGREKRQRATPPTSGRRTSTRE